MAATNADTFHDINTQRRDRGMDASIRLCAVFGASLAQGDSDVFLHLKNGATVSHLGSHIELPPRSFAQTQVACAHAVEQSIPSAQVTSLQSAQLFSACAINSVAERADCLCRKYLTPDPRALREIDFLFLHGSGELDLCQCINHEIWVFVHAPLMVVCLSPCTVFCKSVMYYLVLCSGFMISD